MLCVGFAVFVGLDVVYWGDYLWGWASGGVVGESTCVG